MTLFADPAAERATISSVFIAGDVDPDRIALLTNDAYARLAAVVRAEDFYDTRHAAVWIAMGHVAAAGQGIETVTVNAAMRAHRISGDVSPDFVARLTVSSVPSSNAEAHATIVAALSARRRAIAAADAHRARLLDGGDIAASVATLESGSRDGITGPRDISVGAAFDEGWDRMTESRLCGARYGLRALDGAVGERGALGGLFGGQLTALGAVPGGGKTALAATATIATAQGGGRVLFAALEMPRTDLAWRFAAGFCRVPVSVDHINTGTINQREADDLQRASREVSALPILVEDRDLTVNALCALATAEHSRGALSLIVVDYLHLLGRDAGDDKIRTDEVLRRQVYALKGLAKKLRAPVLMLVQFNRSGAKSERPTMFDALGGSAIEQGADNVVILVPDASATGVTVRVRVHVDKRRGGPPCREGVDVYFNRARQRFIDSADDGEGMADGPAHYADNDLGDDTW